MTSAVTLRLYFNEERFTVRNGIKTRSVRLAELVSLTTLTRGTSWRIVARDRSGGELLINLTVGYKRQDEWAPLLVRKAEAAGIEVTEDVRRALIDPPSWLQ